MEWLSTTTDKVVENFYVDQLSIIPEPATIGLLGFVGSSLVWFRKRFAA